MSPASQKQQANHAQLRRRQGVVLMIVLVVVVMLALAGYTFSKLMLTHHRSTKLSGHQAQTRSLVDSGVDAVRSYLIQDEEIRQQLGGHFDNPDYFQAASVLLDPTGLQRGNFTVLSPAVDQDGMLGGVRYGLEDVSSRLNLNALLFADENIEGSAREILMALPGMSEEIADAILDWIDEDEEIREYGVESEYYSTLDPPYAAKNQPLDTVEELLLVRGVTPQLLFGADANRNGTIDPHEFSDPMGSEAGIDAAALAEVELERGWAAYLTLFSQERNVNALGQPRIFLNNDNLEELYSQLTTVFDEEWAIFIVAYRQAGAYDGQESGESGAGQQLDFEQEGKNKLTQVLDLIGKKVEIKFQGNEQPTVLQSPFPEDPTALAFYLPTLLDQVSTSKELTIPGRININETSATVLAGIPGMTEDILASLLERRGVPSEETALNMSFQHETWLLTEGIVTLEEMKSMIPFVCTGGDVFQAQIVGYYEDEAAASRAEVIFDATTPLPRVLFWRDISHLGRGYPLDVLGASLSATFEGLDL